MTIPKARRPAPELVRSAPIYAMCVPGLLYFLLFCYVPMAGIVLVFKDYNVVDGIFGSPWANPWYLNFRFFFTSARVPQVTFNTLFLNLFFLVTSLVCQMGLALLFNEMRVGWLKKVSQSIVFLPYFMSWVVVGGVVYSFFSNEYGVVNSTLRALGMEAVKWYQSPQYWRAILIFTHIWKWSGYGSVIYMAAIMGIDPSLYESATIDGAGRFRQAMTITVPLLKPTAVVLVLMSVGRIFFGDFGMVYGIVRDNGILLEQVEVIDTYVYRSMRVTGDFSLTTAIGMYQSLMGLMLLTLANWAAKKINDGSGLF
jgi:putative aldouronate transport system permease protein